MALRFIPSLHRVAHRVALHVERRPDLGVTQGEAHILAHLAAHGDSTIAALHIALAHKRSTLTSILDRLVARGLVHRESHDADRRTFVVSLTEDGRRLADEVRAHLEVFERRALRGLSKQQLDGFVAVLAALEGAVDEEA